MWYLNDMRDETGEYDLSAANTLLDEAGWLYDAQAGVRKKGQTPLEFTLIFTESEEYYREVVANIVVKQLAQVGITATVSEQSAEEFESLLTAKTFDMALASFYMQSNNDISFLFDDGAHANYGEYNSSELNALIDDANDALTDDELVTSFTALEQELRTAYPHIGLYFKEHSLLIDSNIAGVANVVYKDMYAAISDWHFVPSG